MKYPEPYRPVKEGSKPQAREMAKTFGIGSLNNKELIMLLLGNGTKCMPVSKLAESVLQQIDRTEHTQLYKNLCAIRGIGEKKALLVLAALELGYRLNKAEGTTIKQPQDILPLIRHYALERQEYFLCASLNSNNEIIKIHVVSIGTINRTITHPREIFANAICDRATAIILCHNHPSGNVLPSVSDQETTNLLCDAANIIGIRILDHIIFSSREYYSFQEHNFPLQFTPRPP